MAVLSVNDLCKSYGDKDILSHVTFSINKNDKAAIIGDNGEGKTTLLKILTKQLQPDKGNVYFEPKTTIGYLSQEVISNLNNTLYEEMELAFEEIKRIEKEMESLIQKISIEQKDEDVQRYSYLEEQFQIKGGYDYRYQIESLLNKFGFNSSYYQRVIRTFSGGEKTRASFVKLLLRQPNVLLLDEPTNHLDLVMIEWLEKYLKSYPGTVLIVTHDRVFVDNLVNKIIEIENHQCCVYPGNYTYYSKEKILRYEQQLKQYNLQEKEIKRYEMLIRKFRPKPTKTAFAASLELKLKKMEKIEKPKNHKKTIKTNFKSDLQHRVLMHTIKELTFGYDQALTKPLTLDIYNQDKICIMGQNGSGKTTLIQCLMNNAHKISGENYDVRDIKYFYFDQNQEILNPSLTLFDTIQNEFPLMTNTEVRTYLGRFLFVEDEVFKKVENLSGGEKMRLIFALISLRNYQVLYLDEPTNHLDFSTKQVIADILEDYQGTIIMVSHDRYFINRVANKIIYLQNQEFIIEEGNYEHFLTLHKIENNRFSFAIKANEKIKKEIKEVAIKKKSSKKDIEKIEKEILKKEEALNLLQEKMNDEEGQYDWLQYRQMEEEVQQIELELHDLLIKLENQEE